MGIITDENKRVLGQSETYEEAQLTGMEPAGFSIVLSGLIAAKKTSIQKVVDVTGLSKSYINKLRNLKGIPVQPTRPVILNIGLALDLSYDEINNLLKAARYQELYARSTADSIIIWGLLHGLTGDQIRCKLSEMGIGNDILRQE